MEDEKKLEIFIPAVFVLQAIMGLNGIVWGQPVADVLSIVIAAALFVKTIRAEVRGVN